MSIIPWKKAYTMPSNNQILLLINQGFQKLKPLYSFTEITVLCNPLHLARKPVQSTKALKNLRLLSGLNHFT